MPGFPSHGQDRWLALLLGLLFPGLGHVYLGKRWAVPLMILVPACLLGGLFQWTARGFTGFVAISGVLLAWWIGAAVHAYRTASLVGSQGPPRSGRSALYMGLGLLCCISLWPLGRLLLPHLRYRAMAIPGSSMRPTLWPGDRYMLNTDWYDTHPLRVGDLVAVEQPRGSREWVLRRCVALEGETVSIREGVLFVNETRRPEPYLDSSTWSRVPDEALAESVRSFGPVTIPQGSFFCLGDERNISLDGRIWGPVARERLRGKAIYLWWGRGRAGIGRSLDGEPPAN